VDAHVYAQALYVGSVDFGEAGKRNVVYVATMRNTLMAVDADTGEEIWRFNAGPPVQAELYQFFDIQGHVGILSTPVIDLPSRTLFLVSNNHINGEFLYRLHAVDIVTGRPRPNSPTTIEASVEGRSIDSEAGRLPFRAYDHLQRPGLALSRGVLYIAFGSHGDDGPYHGWLLAYDSANIGRRVAAFNVTPDGDGGAIWQGGRAPAIDSQGNLYVVSANGDYTGARNFGQSVIKLRPAPELAVDSWFTPADWEELNFDDFEIGSSGAMLLPGDDFVVAGGKRGVVHLMPTTHLDGLERLTDPVGQSLPAVGSFGIFTMAFWGAGSSGILYVRGVEGGVEAFRIGYGTMEPFHFAQSEEILGTPYQGMAVSSDGLRDDTGILWMATAEDLLRAYLASDVRQELWNSGLDQRDDLGSFAKFATPTIANGKVYVPTFAGYVRVYGLLDHPCSPVVAPAGQERR
jgi:outer membrane protein assembly factor BamB